MIQQVFFLRAAGALGALAVILGAFGAHFLSKGLTHEMLEVFQTGVRYHFYHTLALLAVAANGANIGKSVWAPAACYAWIGGIAVFSGSLYLLAITGQKWLGAVTPVGGVALIAGWGFLIAAAGRPAARE